MRISDKGAEFIASFEKEVLHVYDDGFGYPTAGIGHLLTPAEFKQFPLGTPITKEQSRAWWLADLTKYVNAVSAAVKVLITQNEADACISLCFNIGIAGFDHSSVLAFLNEEKIGSAANAFLRWNKVKGVVVKGLVRRREAEKEIFLSPDSSAAVPSPTRQNGADSAGGPISSDQVPTGSDTGPQEQPPIHQEAESQ